MSDESSSSSEKYDEAKSAETSSTWSLPSSTQSVSQLPDIKHYYSHERHSQTAGKFSQARSMSDQNTLQSPLPLCLLYNSDFQSAFHESPFASLKNSHHKYSEQRTDETSLSLFGESSSESTIDCSQNNSRPDLNPPLTNKLFQNPLRITKTNNNANNSIVATPRIDTPRKSYQKIWRGAGSDPKNGIISLLKDYTKGNTNILSDLSLFMHGHSYRPYTKDVRNLLKNADGMSAQEMVHSLQKMLNKDSYNPKCSLQKRMDFIQDLVPDLFISLSKPVI